MSFIIAAILWHQDRDKRDKDALGSGPGDKGFCENEVINDGKEW